MFLGKNYSIRVRMSKFTKNHPPQRVLNLDNSLHGNTATDYFLKWVFLIFAENKEGLLS